MASLWEIRDLPVLKQLVEYDALGYRPDLDELYEVLLGDNEAWTPEEIMASLHALAEADPPFIKADFGDVDQSSASESAYELRLTERGFRAAGAWPSADPYDQLMKLLAERINAEDEPEVKSKLVRFRESVQGIGREVLVGVLTSLARQSAGLP
jgi:hypothetical protein